MELEVGPLCNQSLNAKFAQNREILKNDDLLPKIGNRYEWHKWQRAL